MASPHCVPQDPLSYRFSRAPPVHGARKDGVEKPAGDHRSQRILGEDDTVELYRMFALAAAESAALQRATEGLGKLPPIVSSASNLILFNSTENPYKKCASRGERRKRLPPRFSASAAPFPHQTPRCTSPFHS